MTLQVESAASSALVETRLRQLCEGFRGKLPCREYDELVETLRALSPRVLDGLWHAVASVAPVRVRMKVRGLPLTLRSGSSIEEFRAATAETKEPETLDWLDRVFVDKATLYDIGANVGLYSIYAAMRNPSGHVVAFEPAVSNVASLCANVKANALNNVMVCTIALGAAESLEKFRLSSLLSGSSMHSLNGADLEAFGEQVALEQVLAVSTVDAVAQRLEPPTVIKIDVDGGEADVIAGAQQTLRAGGVRGVLLEVNWISGNDGTRTDAVEKLLDCGFRMVAQGREHRRHLRSWCNYIFERRDACSAPKSHQSKRISRLRRRRPGSYGPASPRQTELMLTAVNTRCASNHRCEASKRSPW